MSDALDAALGASTHPDPLSPPSRPQRSWWLPVVVLVGFIVLFTAVSWERWLPATPVDVIRVTALKRGTAAPVAGQTSGTSLAFQAAGWIEPDPSIVRATALVSGVIATVPVVEGQRVTAGDILATLDPEDLKLALAAAQADAATTRANLQAATTAVTVISAESHQLAARIKAQEAVVAERRDRAQRLAAAGAAVSTADVTQADLQQANAEQALAALQAETAVLTARRAEADARVAQQAAILQAKQIGVAKAALDLERCTIRAPITGIIRKLYAVPGRKQMLGSDMAVSTTVAELFDPAHMQVRVDVALADAGGLSVGQQARIESELLPHKTFSGTVTRIEGHADLTRNTLQAKVRIEAPDERMRPEMLCRVQFLDSGKGSDSATATTGGRLQLLIPADLVPAGSSSATVWLVDADERARQQAIQLGNMSGAMREVLEGAPAGAWLIRNPPPRLRDGQRVQIRMEDDR